MKRICMIAVASAVLGMLVLSCGKKQSDVSIKELKDLKDSASYAYGYLSGLQAKEQGNVELNAEIFARAFRQGYAQDSTAVFTQDQSMNILEKYSRSQQQQQYQNAVSKAKPNIEAAEKFLADNKTKQGVKTTASGLQYKVEKQGKGVFPRSGHGDRIRFLYSLNVLDKDGKQHKVHSDFDKPDTRPQLMGVDNFIPGFVEAVQMMNAGSRYTIWIHPDMGYGMQDSPDIPAGSLLIFDIEVNDVLQGEDR